MLAGFTDLQRGPPGLLFYSAPFQNYTGINGDSEKFFLVQNNTFPGLSHSPAKQMDPPQAHRYQRPYSFSLAAKRQESDYMISLHQPQQACKIIISLIKSI